MAKTIKKALALITCISTYATATQLTKYDELKQMDKVLVADPMTGEFLDAAQIGALGKTLGQVKTAALQKYYACELPQETAKVYKIENNALAKADNQDRDIMERLGSFLDTQLGSITSVNHILYIEEALAALAKANPGDKEIDVLGDKIPLQEKVAPAPAHGNAAPFKAVRPGPLGKKIDLFDEVFTEAGLEEKLKTIAEDNVPFNLTNSAGKRFQDMSAQEKAEALKLMHDNPAKVAKHIYKGDYQLKANY